MIKNKIIDEIKKQQNSALAEHHLRFFKTGEGEYGEGDLFYGLTVPMVRKIVNLFYQEASLEDIDELIKNPYHEVRACGLFIMVAKFQKATGKEKAQLIKLYLENRRYVNNWDLVDLSAPYLTGVFWYNKDLTELWDLAKSGELWSERIAVITTFGFIKKGHYNTTLELCEFFLNHKHDLIHKATGWMLREVGKRDLKTLLGFLDKHHKTMPRTMLRYSIEKLSPEQRKFYMAK
jgi:3-methyladenine DNA glycosylase AlkD